MYIHPIGKPMQLVDLRFNLLLCHERLLAAMEGAEVSERHMHTYMLHV